MSLRRTNPVIVVLVYGVLSALGVVVVLPLLWLVLGSFKLTEDFTTLFLPAGGVRRLTGQHYHAILVELGLGRALVNSIFISSTTSVLATLSCAAGGFALARHEFFGKKLVLTLVLTALIIPPPLLLAPSYQWLFTLGLLDSYVGLILPLIAPAFGVFLFRQATIQGIPKEMLEAARIDGCGELGAFFILGLPLLRPMVGAFLMITFLATWNNWVLPQVILQTPEKQPLSVAITQLRGVYFQDYGLLMAGTVVSVLPVMGLFLLLQREFISGLTMGAVKG